MIVGIVVASLLAYIFIARLFHDLWFVKLFEEEEPGYYYAINKYKFPWDWIDDPDSAVIASGGWPYMLFVGFFIVIIPKFFTWPWNFFGKLVSRTKNDKKIISDDECEFPKARVVKK